jgi:hypothetical protein
MQFSILIGPSPQKKTNKQKNYKLTDTFEGSQNNIQHSQDRNLECLPFSPGEKSTIFGQSI